MKELYLAVLIRDLPVKKIRFYRLNPFTGWKAGVFMGGESFTSYYYAQSFVDKLQYQKNISNPEYD